MRMTRWSALAVLGLCFFLRAASGEAGMSSPPCANCALTDFANIYTAVQKFADGSSTAPSITFASAPTTGIFLAAGAIRFAFGGTMHHAFSNNRFDIRSDTGALWFGTTPDMSITRAGVGLLTYTATTFAALGTPANGTVAYCSNCTIANPCASGGGGAFAKRLNGVWVCD